MIRDLISGEVAIEIILFKLVILLMAEIWRSPPGMYETF